METKIDYDYISSFSKAFTEKIARHFFSEHEFCDGKAMLQATPVNQINLFAIKIIFQQWKEEMNRLKSPFFNYQEPEVKAAMKQFMNTLSRHIKVDQNNFYPLMQAAVNDTVLLIFSPYDFYRQEFLRKPKVSLNELKEIAKYIRINQKLMKMIIQRLEQTGENSFEKQKVADVLDHVLSDTSELPESTDVYLQDLLKVEALDTNRLYRTEREASSSGSEKASGGKTDDNRPLTLNDRFSNLQKTSLAEILQNQKIDNVKNHITINQKFMFVKELFNGDTEQYNQALEKVDNCHSMEEALNYLQYNYVEQNDWDMESEEVNELMEVLSKKYGREQT